MIDLIRLKAIAVMAIMMTTVCAAAQTTSERDSAYYYLAQKHYEDGKVAICVEECKTIIRQQTFYATDAKVLLALCRERQGFRRAAIRIYKELMNKDKSALGTYHYASMFYRSGHLDKAQALAQLAIKYNKDLPEPHMLLASVMASKYNRFEAMMPLYYFMLINDDAEKQRLAYKQMVSLWRQSGKAMRLLKKDRQKDPFNDMVNAQIDEWTTDDSISIKTGKDQIEELGRKTEKLFVYLLEKSEENLDFWQIYYSDFFVKLVPRNFVVPYVYCISDATHHPEVLEWISGDEGDLFNEFRLWMEAQ